ncbi:MAG: DUF924 family protein [Pseudomonadota bacterium]
MATAAEVVAFWREAGPSRWFAKSDAFDADFKARFESTHLAAAAGALDDWAGTAEGALALLVMLDQFPRNAYRGSARMFATDASALDVSRRATAAGFDQQIEPALRAFFYLPFMHSESLADQAQSVLLNAALDDNTQRFAVLHRDIVARFGRFPHRNAVLGRVSTPAEQAFLNDGGFAG